MFDFMSNALELFRIRNSDYVGGSEPEIVKPYVHAVLRRFADEIEPARQRYAAFVVDGLADRTWEYFYPKQGGANVKEQFIEEAPRSSGPVPLEAELPHVTLGEIMKVACERFGLDLAALKSPSNSLHLVL